VDEEESDDLVRPGTKDTRELETTFVKYQEIFRDMISEHMIGENSGDHMVGGPGCIVEVDVAQYGQRDYDCGLISERRGLWVLGGIVRESGEIFFEICKDNRRDSETLQEMILRRVRPGTSIITDCWDGRGLLKERGFKRLSLSRGRWFHKKRTLAWLFDLETYFFEFMWRESVKRSGGDLFQSFLRLIAKIQSKDSPSQEFPDVNFLR